MTRPRDTLCRPTGQLVKLSAPDVDWLIGAFEYRAVFGMAALLAGYRRCVAPLSGTAIEGPTGTHPRLRPYFRSVEIQDIFIFDCVSALHHQAIVVVGFPEESGVFQVFCEIAVHVRSSVLDTSAAS